MLVFGSQTIRRPRDKKSLVYTKANCTVVHEIYFYTFNIWINSGLFRASFASERSCRNIHLQELFRFFSLSGFYTIGKFRGD